MARAKLIEMHSRKITPVTKGKRKNVYINGADDNYPARVESVINNSVTAKMGANKMASFIIGKGFKNTALNDFIFNKKKQLTGYDLLSMLANSVTRQKGAWMQVNYNGTLAPDTLDVLPYKYCRKEKEDDIDNLGRVYYSDQWGASGFSFSTKNEKSKWFYPFNPNEQAIVAQMKADGVTFDSDSDSNVNTFRGQCYFLNFEPENIYPLAYIDPAYNDADSEYHASIHRNNTIKNGFTDKQLVVAKVGTEEEPNDIKETMQSMIGADGANIGLIEVSADSEDLTKEIHSLSLGNDVKSERYKYFDDVNQSKILQTYENIPEALVLGSDGSLIGDGGKKLEELKINYSEDVAYIRKGIEQMLKKVMPQHDWAIAPLVESEVITLTPDEGSVKSEETLKAQAGLKGSVGGVQGILAIKQSFSEGKTDFESAIAILIEIYGFTREVAISLLGQVKTEVEILEDEQEIVETNE